MHYSENRRHSVFVNIFSIFLGRINHYKYILMWVFPIGLAVALLQNVSEFGFLKRELIYLASPHYDIKGISKSIVFLGSYLSTVFFLWLSIFVRNKLVWVVTFLFIVIFFSVDLFIQLAVNNRGFTKFEYAIAVLEAGNYKNMAPFIQEILRSLGMAILFSLLLIFIRKTSAKRIAAKWFIITLIGVLCLTYFSKQLVYYIKYESYPAIVKIPLIIADYHAHTKEVKPRLLDENIIPTNKNTFNENIVWIIDESIAGQYLSINGYNKKTTPYLESLRGSDRFVNYGVVNSVANCSAFSNLMMRIGLSSHTKGVEADYTRLRDELPTIFQYAKRAGFKTWLLDSQADQGQFQNYLTPYDLNSIDEFITLDTRTEDFKRDYIMLEKISEGLRKNTTKRNFVVLIKDGAHWPYLWRYPRDKEIFHPTQASIYEERSIKNKSKLVNTYLNVVRYTVDDFFMTYLNEIDVNNTLTFYTSDHGQNLMESFESPLTHCSNENAVMIEAQVPLFILGKDAVNRFPLNSNRLYSQYQIFPTVLSLMGYGEEIVSNYGKTLIEGEPMGSARWFYWGLEGQRKEFDISENSR